jgi:prepilin-type N-terminal cleavage/methylation domain-containing protein
MNRDTGLSRNGFTIIEVAVVMAILGILTLVVAMLMLRTVDTYGQMALATDTTKSARHCLERISREMRESTSFHIVSDVAGPPLGAVQDALLLRSARNSAGVFCADGATNYYPDPQSITLYYLNTTNEGVIQLMEHHLFYAQDLNAFPAPFFLQTPDPYSGTNLVIVDNVGTAINIDRATGAVNGTPPLIPPRALMNNAVSFDVIGDGSTPLELRVSCQVTDRNGRTATTRLRAQVDPRNL